MNIYHKRFLSSCSCENMVGLFSRYRGAAKEVTESMGMLEAARKLITKLDEHKVIVVGDGCSPRTGILFAYLTRADVVSVDPNFNMLHWEEHVAKQTAIGFPPQRIRLLPAKIEDVEIDCEGRPCLVLWPHSHADMRNARITNYTQRSDIAMPCCVQVPAEWMQQPHIMFVDRNVLSPKNHIHAWLLHTPQERRK